MTTKTIEIKYAGETAILTCNLAEASAPLVVNGGSTPYSTASARHDTARAVLLACKDVWPETRWPSDPTDGDEAWDDVEYRTVDDGVAVDEIEAAIKQSKETGEIVSLEWSPERQRALLDEKYSDYNESVRGIEAWRNGKGPNGMRWRVHLDQPARAPRT